MYKSMYRTCSKVFEIIEPLTLSLAKEIPNPSSHSSKTSFPLFHLHLPFHDDDDGPSHPFRDGRGDALHNGHGRDDLHRVHRFSVTLKVLSICR